MSGLVVIWVRGPLTFCLATSVQKERTNKVRCLFASPTHPTASIPVPSSVPFPLSLFQLVEICVHRARSLSLSFSLCSRCVFDLFLWSWRETRHESIKASIQEKPHNLYQHVRPTCPSLALFHVLCLDSHRILVNKPKRRKGSPYARVDSHATRIVPESLASSSWLAMWSYFNLQILRSSLASLWGWNNLNTHTCISVIKDQGSWRLTRNRRRWVWIRLCELW